MANLSLVWLGQSGFLLRAPDLTWACDLYLSDYCRRRSRLDHTRLTPIPVTPEALERVDHYLITHAHIDHFDPETVGPILRKDSATRFYCPPAGRAVWTEHFPEAEARFTVLASETEYPAAPGWRLIPLPAAHEGLERDAGGEYLAFSYLLLSDIFRQAVFFAGDTIPYAGQGELIRKYRPAGYGLTLVLPVNGRDAPRAKLGFKGNLNLDEAAALRRECLADRVVPCHFNMFALNDAPIRPTLEEFAARQCPAATPEIGQAIALA